MEDRRLITMEGIYNKDENRYEKTDMGKEYILGK
jgi:hypothetical protein